MQTHVAQIEGLQLSFLGNFNMEYVNCHCVLFYYCVIFRYYLTWLRVINNWLFSRYSWFLILSSWQESVGKWLEWEGEHSKGLRIELSVRLLPFPFSINDYCNYVWNGFVFGGIRSTDDDDCRIDSYFIIVSPNNMNRHCFFVQNRR